MYRGLSCGALSAAEVREHTGAGPEDLQRLAGFRTEKGHTTR